jgi:manganese transport protein
VPALALLASGFDATWALVLSQVLLSLGIPFALVPLAALTSNRAVMGRFANSRRLVVLAWSIVAAVVALNVALVVLTVVEAVAR